jgi:hypothetical protein
MSGVLVLIAVAVAIQVAQAASAYDGKWEGQANGSQASGSHAASECVATIAGTIASGVFKGTLAFPRTTVTFGGTVAPDGSFKSDRGALTGKFDGNAFTGSFSVPNGYCNPYRVTMTRP